jgi:hypothetical protein
MYCIIRELINSLRRRRKLGNSAHLSSIFHFRWAMQSLKNSTIRASTGYVHFSPASSFPDFQRLLQTARPHLLKSFTPSHTPQTATYVKYAHPYLDAALKGTVSVPNGDTFWDVTPCSLTKIFYRYCFPVLS